MSEIILSFFAIIGMLFLIIYICDYFFYRNFKQTLVLTIDLTEISSQECIEIFELITSVRQTTIGKAVISFVQVLVSETKDEKANLAKEYMRVFKIPGTIQAKSMKSITD